METSPSKSATHPMFLIAAASVAAVSFAGIGYLAGWLPGPGKSAESAVITPTTQVMETMPENTKAPSAKSSETTAKEPAKESSAKPVKHRSSAVSSAPTSSHASSTAAVCADCGVVSSVNEVMVEPAGSGVGAVAGGVVGGVLGNQIGKGSGRTIATVLGAAGGAYAGNAIEKSTKKTKRYDVVVRFDDGTTRTFSSTTAPAWRSGDHVRLENGVLTARQ